MKSEKGQIQKEIKEVEKHIKETLDQLNEKMFPQKKLKPKIRLRNFCYKVQMLYWINWTK